VVQQLAAGVQTSDIRVLVLLQTSAKHSSGPVDMLLPASHPSHDGVGPQGHLPGRIHGRHMHAKHRAGPSMAPALIMTSAPAPPSSAGWNTSSTVPVSSASRALSSLAAPSSIVMWAAGGNGDAISALQAAANQTEVSASSRIS